MDSNNQLKGHLRDKLDPHPYAERSLAILNEVDKAERLGWFNHPCTKALLYSLEADIAGILSHWMAGAYGQSESIDATAQEQAKARGMAQAINDVIESIHDIKSGETE